MASLIQRFVIKKCHGRETQHMEIWALQVLGNIPVVQAGKTRPGQHKQCEQEQRQQA